MQIYLIVPPNTDKATHETSLELVQSGLVAAMLIQRGTLADDEYRKWAKSLIAPAQQHGVAALLDNMPEAVQSLKADGAHLTQGAKETGAWSKKLKPDAIVGAGEIFSRHDAMTNGEQIVDYIFFGHLDPSKNIDDEETAEMANWWAETFEVPTVAFVTSLDLLSKQVEFCAVREQVYEADDPLAALKQIHNSVNSK